MAELEGTLAGADLPPVVRLLTALGKTGRLRIVQGGRSGELAFERGRIVAATFGSERGMAAIDAILLALPQGRFAFFPGRPPRERGLEMTAEALERHAEAFAPLHRRIAALIPSPDVVPHRRPAAALSLPAPRQDGILALERSVLQMLLAVDGRTSVAALAVGRGLAATAGDLTYLAEMGLIRIPPRRPANDAPDGHPATNGRSLAPPSEALPPSKTTTAAVPPPVAAPVAAPRRSGSWARTAVLAAVTAVFALIAWQQAQTPSRPAPPTVLLATPTSPAPAAPQPAPQTVPQTAPEPGATQASPAPAAATPAPTLQPAQLEALRRISLAITRRDARALAAAAAPSGVGLAPFSGGLPDDGYPAEDADGLAQAIMGSSEVQILGWRAAGDGGIIVLADGWRRGTVRLAGNVTYEMSSLGALALMPEDGAWYWRWVMPDPVGALAHQARNVVWQPWPL